MYRKTKLVTDVDVPKDKETFVESLAASGNPAPKKFAILVEPAIPMA